MDPEEIHRRSRELDEDRSAGCSWEEIRQALGRAEIPPEHLALLDARRARVAAGESTLHDWDEVSHRFNHLKSEGP